MCMDIGVCVARSVGLYKRKNFFTTLGERDTRRGGSLVLLFSW